MDLFFVRHATAENKSAWTEDDALRPLTRAGRERFAEAARVLTATGALDPDVIISSPLVRARQTADILAAALDGDTPVEQDPRLGPGFDVDDARAIIAEHARSRSVALVGHNPNFALVLSALVGGGSIVVRKGSIALVEIPDVDRPEGRLMWLVPTTLLASGDRSLT